MTARQLAEQLNNLPEEQKDLEVIAYNRLEEAYEYVRNPTSVPYEEARYVKADYPWVGTNVAGNFIEI